MKIITGTWQNSDGTPVSGGRVFFTLNADAVTASGLLISASIPTVGNLDQNGKLATEMWASDEFNPSTPYSVAVLSAGGGLVWKGVLVISGVSPINLNNVVPA